MTLPPLINIVYDLDHMQIEPFHMLPPMAFRRQKYAKNDVVFKQGEDTRGLFFVLSGQVNLCRYTESGHVITVHRATANSLFAEASLFSDRYHCDAQCNTACDIFCIDKAVILKCMDSEPKFSKQFNKLLASQIQNYRQILEILAIKSATDRILVAITAGYLVGSVIDFASQIGLTHEACYRGLRKLTREGILIQTGRGKYTLTHDG
jgi:CRP-like cAMP-binding protein